MTEPTIDSTEYCSVCGSPIWSETSKRRGYGGECAAAIRDAKAKRVFADADLKKKYYQIEAELLIELMKKQTFKSKFRQSFQETLAKQATWLSKRQKEIAYEILFEYDGEARRSFENMLHQKHELFWDEIPVTREDIEIARKSIRGKRAQ